MPAALPFSAADLRRRVARLPDVRGAVAAGDAMLNPHHRRLSAQTRLRDAAVLIGVVDHAEEATVILTKRAETLRSHTGQIALPGGRIDPEDSSPEAAALREAEEEIGLAPSEVELVGRLPDYVSGTGYRIAPVLGVVRPGFALAINPAEVDAAFEVPLGFLMNPLNHHRESRVFDDDDERWFYYAMPFGERRIWGVTAGIIRTLYERLYA